MPNHAHEAIPNEVSTKPSSNASQCLSPGREEPEAAADRHRLRLALVSA
jgi:hypothetical protein